MTRLEVRYETGDETHVVGELLSLERTIYFEYAPRFRELGVELSPFRLPLDVEGPVEDRDRTFRGLHGLFNDSLPDGWGSMLMERALRAQGVDTARITPLDRLAFIGSRGMGALTYHPPANATDDDVLAVDLATLAAQSERILAGSTEDVLPELVRAGASPMGARPKLVAGVRADYRDLVTGTADLPEGYSHWLINFAARDDPRDIGAIEAAYADMARAAGISFPRTHLFVARDDRRYFGVERFDRDPDRPSRRIHVHTFAGLVHHDHRFAGQDYVDLLKVTRILTRNHQDVVEAFRRMVFNILAHNRDDHTKNFAFRMTADGEWRIAPAYDVTFSAGPAGEHTMMVAGAGLSPTIAHVNAVAAVSSLEPREVREVMDTLGAAVAEWPRIAERHDVARDSVRDIQQRLDAVRKEFESASAAPVKRGRSGVWRRA